MSDYDWSRHLQEDEELLWQGRPDKRFRFFMRTADLLIVPVFSFLLYFSVTSWANSLQNSAPNALADVPPPQGAEAGIMLAAAYVLFGRAAIDRVARRNLRYALTNHRILRAHKRLGILNRIDITKDLKLDVLQGRFTTIRFNQAAERGTPPTFILSPFFQNYLLMDAMMRGYADPGPEFRAIKDGPNVSRLLKSLRAAATEAAA